jgi:NAD(P)H-quinone oxidoreductase subunit H
MLRGPGVKLDLRKVDHYECYDDFDSDVCWETGSDILARYFVRM